MRERNRDKYSLYLTIGIICSLLVHISLAIMFSEHPKPTFEPVLEVSIEPPPELKEAERQIVAPSKIVQPQLPPPENTKLESDQDMSTDHEQINRGQPDAGAAPGPQAPVAPPSQPAKSAKPAKEKPAPVKEREVKPAKPQKLDLSALDDKTLLEKFSIPKPKPKPPQDPLNDTRGGDIGAYAPFSRPSGSGAAILGHAGSNDYLPSLPDGDITLLNAKANKFAVFVQRVASQVFAQLRSNGWDLLRGPEINSVSNFATIKAVLSPQGKVLSVTIVESSGSERFDRVVRDAAKVGVRDPNPPTAAALEDGNIHFIFQSRCWAEVFPAARTGQPVERRWLLLGTGLE